MELILLFRHLSLLYKHENSQKNDMLASQHTTRVGRNYSSQCTRYDQLRKLTLVSESLR